MEKTAQSPAVEVTTLQADPEPLPIDRQKTAVIIIDMQNAFAGEGGFFNLMGFGVSETPKIVENINNVTRTARASGIMVIHVVHHHSPDRRETGGPNAGYWYKASQLGFEVKPEWYDKCFVRGTWGAEIVDGLEVLEDDIVVIKPRYSAFFGTNLDTILKTFNKKYLAFAGVSTNMCVEGTIRDACYRDYFPILISDATAPGGPPSSKDATIHNILTCLGWVTNSGNLIKALKK